MSIAGIVLAAGLSRRLGRPKQTIVLGGETLVERTARVALAAGLSPVLAVLNPLFTLPLGHIEAVEVVLNGEADEGMASSIRAGLQRLQSERVDGTILMTCDQIAITPAHLRALCAQPDRITGSRYQGTVAVPAYFPSSAFDALLQLRGDKGARDLLRAARAVATDDLALDIDTEDDLKRAQSWIEQQRFNGSTT